MKVKIPFQERFRDKLLNGEKTVTSRTRRHGNEDDTFDAFGATFRIKIIGKARLDAVASHLWKQEGAESPEDFRSIWESIHPRKGYVPDQVVWTHVFERI